MSEEPDGHLRRIDATVWREAFNTERLEFES